MKLFLGWLLAMGAVAVAVQLRVQLEHATRGAVLNFLSITDNQGNVFGGPPRPSLTADGTMLVIHDVQPQAALPHRSDYWLGDYVSRTVDSLKPPARHRWDATDEAACAELVIGGRASAAFCECEKRCDGRNTYLSDGECSCGGETP